MKIGVLGTGYVGLVASVCFADAGHEVSCVDSNKDKLKSLREGTLPFYEPGLDDLFQRNRKRMQFFDTIAEATLNSEVIFVAVGTPELPDGSADLGPTMNCLEQICQNADTQKVVVLKSTVPIGTARKAQAFCQEHCKHKIEIVNNPEFLKQGAALEDFLKPDRVVIGCQTEDTREKMRILYEPFLRNGNPIIFMDNTSAEMTKYAANSFLALKISFINELALLADKLGADIDSVREGFTSDRRIDPSFFYPGIGYGGSCFPKDVRALVHTAQEKDLELLLLLAADKVNERQKTILSDRLQKYFGNLKDKRIALWGLAFKPRTDDVRRAPSLKLIEELHKQGANIVAYDPVAIENAKAATKVPFEIATSALAAAKGADALVIVTEWNEFRSADLRALKQAMKQPIVFDGRNIFDPERMRDKGFEYFNIGRQAQSQMQI